MRRKILWTFIYCLYIIGELLLITRILNKIYKFDRVGTCGNDDNSRSSLCNITGDSTK